MKHILIVDDNKANLTAAKTALSEIYKTTAVVSGAQALKFLEKNIPDIILLDINMPEMDGFEVLERIRAMPEGEHIPVIFLTADNDVETEQRCFDSGAVDFIAKPFVTTVMRSRIGRTLELEELRKSLADRLDEKIKEVSDIKSKSNKDALTGLWNRAHTEEKVSEMIGKGIKGALFMMDMDNFKAINDNYGHMAGDATLKAFADTLMKFAGEDDVVCRIGGDEFMTFVAGPSSKSELGRHAADIIAEMGCFLENSKFETNSSVSVGIAQFPEDGEDFKSLYNAADKALYCVKQNGKNSYHFYSDQYAAENRRANNSVDICYLREMMHRIDPGKGAYMLDFDNFHYVYNFIRRVVERQDEDVNTILFTLQNDNADPAEVEDAVEMLDRAIFTSLRRADVSARYSSRQVIVMLFDSKESGGQICAERILSCYKKLYTGNLIFDYDIVKMESSGLMKNGRRSADSEVVILN
ncbi:MAG: diguanylate cyclase [Oscillospiraceae bacterium]|nr:diguanylate cyclase [Oscillospiraceae bacterium]